MSASRDHTVNVALILAAERCHWMRLKNICYADISPSSLLIVICYAVFAATMSRLLSGYNGSPLFASVLLSVLALCHGL